MDFNSSGMKSPFSPRVRQSLSGRRPLGLSSSKKNPNHFMQGLNSPSGEVVYKTPHHTIETYGLPLPVMVTEALAFASGELSVRMSPCGWCWLVVGRRVLAWPYEAAAGSSGASSAARELTLPQTDLAHKADLVVLFYDDEDAQMPSCIGVSPEGVVRYWPSIGQEGVYVDVTAELGGQECERLGEPMQAGLLLATTTCTLVLLNHQIVEGRASVAWRLLRAGGGWLGGLGRRVSSLLFGSMPAHADTKLVGVVTVRDGPLLDPDSPDCGCVALVGGAAGGGGGGGPGGPPGGGGGGAGGAVLQLWHRELHEHRVQRLTPPVGDLTNCELAALDVAGAGGAGGGLLLLLAARDTRWALAHLNISDPAAPRVTSLTPLRSWRASEAPPPRLLPLPPPPTAAAAPLVLLYTDRYIATVNTGAGAAGAGAEWSPLEGGGGGAGGGERLLGGALCGGLPLLFTQAHGVLVVKSNDRHQSLCDSPLGSPCVSDVYTGNLSLLEIDPHEISALTTDACGKLKTAFLFHLRRDAAAAAALLHELFPAGGPGGDVDAPLDRTVYRLAAEMLDDVPAGDPRWQRGGLGGGGGGAATSVALGSSAALAVSSQLRDKQRAFSLFVRFLRDTVLARRLSSISQESGSGAVSTWAALGALAERLAGALALHEIQSPVLEDAIRKVVDESADEEDPCVVAGLAGGTLGPRDAMFRRVTRVPRLLHALAAGPPTAQAAEILLTALGEMHKCRAAWGGGGGPPTTSPPQLLTAIADLINRIANECSQPNMDPSARDQALSSVACLADLLLSDAAPLQGDRRNARIYARLRTACITPLVNTNQLERAASLAEKHKDFDILIELCIKSDDMDKLSLYIDKYAAEGFPGLAFSRLAALGGRHRAALLQLRSPALGGWLRARLPALAAAHAVGRADYGAAADLCAQEAKRETKNVERMITVASVGKLALLAGDTAPPAGAPWPALEALEGALRLGAHTMALPRTLRERNGLGEDCRVPSYEELVEMYCSWSDGGLTEVDYQRALELTADIEDHERRDDLRLKVWCACILQDDWAPGGGEGGQDPREQLRDKMFFRLVDLVHLMGGDLELLLPAAEDMLTARQLAELAAAPHFHYLLRLGLETLRETSAMT